MIFRAHYGVTGHHPLGLPERRLSFWCTMLRLSSPLEVTMGSLCVQTYDKAVQDQLRHDDIDLIDEQRWQSAIKNAWYHQAHRHYHLLFVRSRQLQVDDLMLWRVLTQEGANKLSPGREGPFWVTQVCHPGCIRLAMDDGEPLSNPCYIEHLRKFYP
jgi:hypothetical protein